MMKIIVNAILVIVFSTAVAWADDPPPQQITMRLNSYARHMVAMGVNAEHAMKMQNRFQERQMRQALDVIQSAKDRGVPVKPVVDKALEGIAKKVNASNIVRAMEQVRNRYSVALDEAGQLTAEPSLRRAMSGTMVQAMTAGVPVEHMSAIAEQVRNRRQATAHVEYAELARNTFVSARDMARLGATSESVKEIISLALQKQYSAAQMKMLGNKFMHQSLGNKSDDVAGHFLNCIRSGEDVGWQGPANKNRMRSRRQNPGSFQQGAGSAGGSGKGGGSRGGKGNGGGPK